MFLGSSRLLCVPQVEVGEEPTQGAFKLGIRQAINANAILCIDLPQQLSQVRFHGRVGAQDGAHVFSCNWRVLRILDKVWAAVCMPASLWQPC